MNKERLKEIKDSIDLQLEACKTFKQDNELTLEELELYNEVVRLREENEKIKKMNMHEHKYGSDMEEKYLLEKEKNDRALKYLQGATHLIMDYGKPFRPVPKREEQYLLREYDLFYILKGKEEKLNYSMSDQVDY